jgi:polyisoprenyl-teichoic acid--peptidoglycan teichoic acid transferase
MNAPQPQLPARTGRSVPKKRKSRRVLYGIMGVLLLACLLTVGYASYLYFFKMNDMLDKIGTDEAVPAGMSAKDKPLSLLLLGVDSRPESGSLNTDVIMIVSLNPDRKSAAVVSIPRDTYIKATQGLKANKANAFYPNLMASSKSTAQDKIKKVFGSVLNVPIDYMMTVNFQGFKDVVDALGGVTVDVDMDMRYVDKADGTNINLKKGVQKLDGKKALDFVRYRKSNNGTAESSDLERNARQQLVVAEILDKLKSPTGLLKAGEMMDAVGSNVTTDMPSAQLKDMIRTYIGMSKDNIDYIHLEGEWKSPYVYVADADWQKARSALSGVLK